MTTKVITTVTSFVLAGGLMLFAADKAKEKSPAEGPKDEAKMVVQMEQKENLLDQLVAAYKANDREKMGQVIKKMEDRRAKMRELAKLNKWHQGAHRKWAIDRPPRDWQAGPHWRGGWGYRKPWDGPACGRGFAEGRQQWGQCPTVRCPADCCRGWGRDGFGPRASGDHRQMRGCDGWAAPGWGHRQAREWGGCEPEWGRKQGPGPQHRFEPACGEQVESADNIPPPDWGW